MQRDNNQTKEFRNHPLFMQDPLDLSQVDWDIYIALHEPRVFTEYTLSFQKIFTEQPAHAAIICYSEDGVNVRFLVKGTWADIKRCHLSAHQVELQKYNDLNLTWYKINLNSTDCLNQAACKDDIESILTEKASENNKTSPIKVNHGHPIAVAINAAMRVLPNKIKSVFNEAYQAALLQQMPESPKEQIATSDSILAVEAIPTSTAIITTTLTNTSEEKQTTLASTKPIEPPVATPIAVATEPDNNETQGLNTSAPIINGMAHEQTNQPTQALLSSPTKEVKSADPEKNTDSKEPTSPHFLIQLQKLLQQAKQQKNIEFSRHTGLTQLCTTLNNLTADNMQHSYKALQKITAARSSGLRNWLSNATFFCLCQGRDPAVQALYQFISKTSVDDSDKTEGKMILANLQEALNMGRRESKHRQKACC